MSNRSNPGGGAPPSDRVKTPSVAEAGRAFLAFHTEHQTKQLLAQRRAKAGIEGPVSAVNHLTTEIKQLQELLPSFSELLQPVLDALVDELEVAKLQEAQQRRAEADKEIARLTG